MKYIRILAEFHSRAWALPEELLLRMQDLLCAQAAGEKWSDGEIQTRIANANFANGYEAREHLGSVHYAALSVGAASDRRYARSPGKVAVIPITGVISHRMSLVSEISGSGGGSIQSLTAQFRQALGDGDCRAIVFDVDSPGGSVDCVPELSSEIYQARGQKPIIAVCNAMACSAAYWLASAASEVVCTPSGQCGSIGVFMIHVDESKAFDKAGVKVTLIKAGKYKAEGPPFEPLSSEAHSAFQGQVDTIYGMFTGSVARNRGTSQAAVRDGMGQGRSLLANAAVKAGLADRVGTLDSVLQELGVGGARRPGAGTLRDARALGAEEPDPALAARHRRLEIDLMRMGAGGARRSAAVTSDPFQPIQQKIDQKRFRTECMLDARRIASGACGSGSDAPNESLAAKHRRRQHEIDLMRM
jgi:signal peptide peptidase SppA